MKELMERYDAKFLHLSFMDIEKQILAMPDNDPDKEEFYSIYIDTLTRDYMNGFLRYQSSSDLIQLKPPLERYIKCHKNSWMIEAILAFINCNHQKCIDCLTKALTPVDNDTPPFNEADFGELVLGIFKNAFSGFYPALRKVCNSFPTEDLVKQLCEIMDDFYTTEDPDKMAETLYPVLQEHPNSIIGNMLLGYTYYIAKNWGSSIACFEKIEEQNMNMLFWDYDIHFFKAWSYSKLKEHKNAINEYEKVLELYPLIPNALNNMGYEYYLLKQYPKAEQIFKRCLKENRDTKFAANNYIRVLLSTGRYADADVFISNGKYNIISDLKKRVKDAIQNKNPHKDTIPPLEQEDATSNYSQKKQKQKSTVQFSSEKILEDELCRRIDSGIPVFGKQLKLYRRHGEFGRQYIIPIGRLDLLAEDDNGDLYIIELKKDSGYDDPYEQTVAYLDWFEKNHKKGKQKIHGIICLNNPRKELIEKVRKDNRIQLFNYAISYDEVT